MASIVITITAYLNVVLMAYFTITCFQLMGTSSKKASKRLYHRQEKTILFFQLICNMDLYLSDPQTKYILFYLAQAAFALFIFIFYHRIYKGSSRLLTNIFLLFANVGFIMLARLSFENYALKQFVTVALCFVLAIFIPSIMSVFKVWKRLTWIYGILGFLLLATVVVFGVKENGATNWISVAGITLQPSEFAKILFVLFTAGRLKKKQDLKSLMVTTVVAAAYVIVLVLENDLGAALIFFVVYLIMLYAATGRLTLVVLGLAAGSGASVVAYHLFTHVQTRVNAFLDPWGTIDGGGYQICMSLFSFGTGSWFGVGIGQGAPESVPIVYSDFILSAIAEEMGTVFVLCLLLLFLCCFIVFLNAALRCKDSMYKLITLGYGVCFIFQVFLNVGGAVKFIPLTGVTLPLISYGRSSIGSVMLIFAITQGLIVMGRREAESEEEDLLVEKINEFEQKNGLDRKDKVSRRKVKKGRLDRNVNQSVEIPNVPGFSTPMSSVYSNGQMYADGQAYVNAENSDDGSGEESAKHGLMYRFLNSLVRTSKRLKINKQVLVTTYIFVALFLCLMGYIAYYVAVPSKTDLASSYNPRGDLFKQKIIKGDILTADGEAIVTSTKSSDGTYVRTYNYDNLFAQVAGYDINGKSGLEKSLNYYLYDSHENIMDRITEEVTGDKIHGDKVYTTLNLKLQQAASNALGNNRGAVVVMEVKTGKILAMVSKPDYNPNYISATWDELNQTSDSALLNRATQGLYPPGSTFKIVTGLEYIKENPDDWQDYTYNCQGETVWDGVKVHCASYNVHGEETIYQAMAHSCNNAFVNMAMSFDLKSYQKTATSLLYNQELPIDIESSKSIFKINANSDKSEVPQTAFGQGDTLCTPLLNCMIVASVANDGVMMKPMLYDSVVSYDDKVVETIEPEEYKTVMTKKQAKAMQSLLEDVVKEGTASALSGLEHSYAGKTGTAEVGDGSETHAWFVGYSNVEDPEIAVSVLVENGGHGSTTAVPIAKAVFCAYYD